MSIDRTFALKQQQQQQQVTRPLTFSEGTHKCPGERVAMILMQYFVALLLERNAVVLGNMPKVSFEKATLAQRGGPVPVRLEKPGAREAATAAANGSLKRKGAGNKPLGTAAACSSNVNMAPAPAKLMGATFTYLS